MTDSKLTQFNVYSMISFLVMMGMSLFAKYLPCDYRYNITMMIYLFVMIYSDYYDTVLV